MSLKYFSLVEIEIFLRQFWAKYYSANCFILVPGARLVLTINFQIDSFGNGIAHVIAGRTRVLSLVRQTHAPDDQSSVSDDFHVLAPTSHPRHREAALLASWNRQTLLVT